MVPDALRFTVRELRENYADPWWWRHHLGKLAHRYVNAPIQAFHPGYDDAVSVMDEDWDNLLVLDACRADLFEAVADLDAFDRYERVASLGSTTPEWTRHNFADREFGDTVYVSANPHTAIEAGDAFHRLVAVWESDFDETAGTVPPAAVVAAAMDASKAHPDKRLVVHFVQPHHPFVGDEDVATDSGWNLTHAAGEGHPSHPHDPFEAYSMGEVDRETLWEAYADTLALVLGPALELAGDLPGRTVVTSDHGNMVGEPGWPIPVPVYGHQSGLRHPELVAVPWAVLDGDRHWAVTDGETETARVDEETVGDRLRDLGYV